MSLHYSSLFTCTNLTTKMAVVTSGLQDQSLQRRRSANYKPNIWELNLLQSMVTTDHNVELSRKREAKKLAEEVKELFMEEKGQLEELLLADSITKLGLGNHFEKEVKEALTTIDSSMKNNSSEIPNNLYATSLCFRLLRQHGLEVSQDIFSNFVDYKGKFRSGTQLNMKTLIELFEASNFGLESETIIEEAKVFSATRLRSLTAILGDYKLATYLKHVLDLPLHWRVGWYNVRGHIHIHEKEELGTNTTLLKLAKLNFNVVQSQHQKDLKDITSWWWKNLRIAEKLSFGRDRVVESFLFATAVASEPQRGNSRKWLTKVIQLILTIDDLFDIYGSIQELEAFTNAVERCE